ncbi:SCT1 [[Candida] subhashii]|uniref:SCT1 n=1 Tax=[Candida] subhashii TaxID=561895 RepID=A0A8J5URL9_9ASCO|nr:SCT1 [[Candida] subhashii]KAG7664757.1 SCT1 [[Candida] subhashii]
MSAQFDFKYKPLPWYRLAIYDSFLWLLSIIFDCFFREIRPRGAFKIPRDGPVIFVAAPHHNQFVDPIVLMNQVKKEANRRVSFLIAAKSYQLKVVGTMSMAQLSIPVVRPQDNLVKGTGKIFVDFDKDPYKVTGVGTKFTQECMVKGLFALPQSLGASEITQIISDTELRIRKEFKDTDQIRQLLTKGTSFKKADKVDQKQVYQLVFDHLSDGNCIGIFPEGGSHDRPDLLPLKAGVAVMALGAMEHNPDCNVKIVPCGMNYFNAHKFRSRAVVEFGDPIEISKDLLKKYKNPETNRESVKELLDIITTGLKAVTVTCQDYETLMLIQAARRLYAGNFAQQLPLPLIVEMNRRLVMGYNQFKDEPKVQEVKNKVLEYNNFLKSLALPDHDVESCKESNQFVVIPLLIVRIIRLIVLFILALPGATLFSPVFLSTKIISRQKQKEALANSVVKIKGNDVIATWKILVSMGIAPVVYSFYASVGTYLISKHNILPSISLIWVWILLYIAGILVTYSALLTGEQGLDLFKSIRPLYLSIIASQSSIQELKKMRRELSEEITDLVNEFGPTLFPDDFNLLELKQSLNISDKQVDYIDSDEEEERKTQELRQRRLEKRRAQKRLGKKNGGLLDHSSSMSDGISLLNSDNSLTNLPMFSDYQLHMNARENVKIDLLGTGNNSEASIYDDYRFAQPSESSHTVHVKSPLSGGSSKRPDLSNQSSSEQIVLNFENKNLSEKIKNKLRENRSQQDE